MTTALVIDYYTDMLCVWAWIAQRRIDELESQWGDRLTLRHSCVNVFGDTAAKMDGQWRTRGGYAGFADHVQQAAATHEDAPVHAGLWRDVRPATSGSAHLVLKAAQIVDSSEASNDTVVRLARHLREGFFVHAEDIGQLDCALSLAAGFGLPRVELESAIDRGAAMAALMSDYSQADQQGIKGSPSWVMNDGRQILYGNVGYRILNANIEELLRNPEQEASWC